MDAFPNLGENTLQVRWNRDSLRLNVAAGQLAQRSTEPTHGTVQAQYIARALMHSEESDSKALVFRVLGTQLDVELCSSGKTVLRTSCEEASEVEARVVM